MPLQAEQKREIVARVNEVAARARSLVIADARGVNVADISKLRREAREKDVLLRVVKNTLARRALEKTDFACVTESLAGPCLFGFSMQEPSAAAKLFKQFGKDNENFTVKALSFEGRLLDASQLDILASMPTMEEALSMLLSAMQAPVAKLARTANEIPTKLVRVLAAVRDQKQAAA